MPVAGGCETEHEFVLVLSGVPDIGHSVMNPLFEAGCGDAIPSVRFGRITLSFARTAPSLKEAVFSAIRDVMRANIGATVLCVDECNLVSKADIARRIGRSRQMVGQYVAGTRGPGNFPAPVCDLAVGHPLWQWCEVSFWLWENAIVDDAVLNESRLLAAVNSVLDLMHQRRHDNQLVEEVLQFAEELMPAHPA